LAFFESEENIESFDSVAKFVEGDDTVVVKIKLYDQ
jgi:hypothetical protein